MSDPASGDEPEPDDPGAGAGLSSVVPIGHPPALPGRLVPERGGATTYDANGHNGVLNPTTNVPVTPPTNTGGRV